MADPILTLRIDPAGPQFIALDFPDALNDQVNVVVDDPQVVAVNTFTGTAGNDAGQALADTGNLEAGVWRGLVIISSSEAAIDVDFSHRNAADAANVASVRFDQITGEFNVAFTFTTRVLLNESLKCILQTDIANLATVRTKILADRIGL